MSANNQGLGYALDLSYNNQVTTQQNVGGGASGDATGGSLSQSIQAGVGATVTLHQESPQAIAALAATAQTSITQMQLAVDSLGKFETGLAGQAIAAAKDALTPADSRVYNTVQNVFLIAALAVGAYFIFRK